MSEKLFLHGAFRRLRFISRAGARLADVVGALRAIPRKVEYEAQVFRLVVSGAAVGECRGHHFIHPFAALAAERHQNFDRFACVAHVFGGEIFEAFVGQQHHVNGVAHHDAGTGVVLMTMLASGKGDGPANDPRHPRHLIPLLPSGPGGVFKLVSRGADGATIDCCEEAVKPVAEQGVKVSMIRPRAQFRTVCARQAIGAPRRLP